LGKEKFYANVFLAKHLIQKH